jgi:hypothetical protein
MQCAVSMLHYLQQAEQQHKQELLEAEAQVEALRGALGKAQTELQQVGRPVCCHAQDYCHAALGGPSCRVAFGSHSSSDASID